MPDTTITHRSELWNYSGHSAVWEPLTLSMLTFGGVRLNDSLNYTAELWNYSFLTNSWTELAPIGPYPSPEPREDHAVAWDPTLSFMYRFGGFDGSSNKLDFWRYKSLDLDQVPVEECILGQVCELQLNSFLFQEGERIQVVNFLSSSFGWYAVALGGNNFSFENSTGEDSDGNSTSAVDGSGVLLLEPGLYRILHCPKLQCEGHWFELGLLLVAGPFSGQSFVCELGSRCVITGLQGSRLWKTDRLLALKECGTSRRTATFEPVPISNSALSNDAVVFDFGHVMLNGSPEQVQLCWCPLESNCQNLGDYRALAMLLYTVCPPGQQPANHRENNNSGIIKPKHVTSDQIQTIHETDLQHNISTARGGGGSFQR